MIIGYIKKILYSIIKMAEGNYSDDMVFYVDDVKVNADVFETALKAEDSLVKKSVNRIKFDGTGIGTFGILGEQEIFRVGGS